MRVFLLATAVCLAASLVAPARAQNARAPRGSGSPAAHWSFVPPVRPRVPAIRNREWVRNPIDAFVLAALERKGLSPAPEADRRTLLRRVSLTLTGLPPAPDEIEAFVRDRSPDAYEKVVHRLLESPRYGERWGQHWLDVVRFAETNGFELDADRPQAWRYRDWVVQALNEDMPYDRFISLQVAGDELAPDDWDARVATGFLRAGPRHVVGGNVDPAEDRQEWLTEAVNGLGNAVMGLTIGCARCHDHKYDPVPARDYYRLQAFFAAADDQDFQRVTPAEKEAHAAAVRAHQERLKPIRDQIAAIEQPYRERLRKQKLARLEAPYAAALAVEEKLRTPEQRRLASEAQVMLKVDWDELVASLSPADRDSRSALRRKMHAADLEAPSPLPAAPAVAAVRKPVPPTHVLIRGDTRTLGDVVQPGFPGALGAHPAVLPPADAGGRTALARWLARPDHPLTARVMANRLWHYHFGRGIVATPNDFGKNGARPSHPELLDWLATEFMNGSAKGGVTGRGWPAWSLKRLHYLIVTSAAYRQSGRADARTLRLDPNNRLFSRIGPRRLDAEAIRDSALQAAGTINLQMEGPSVRVPLEPEVYDTIFTEGEPDNLWPVSPDPRQHVRRSLYLLRKRNVRLPLFAVFDQPDMMTSCAARGRSVHALQALTLMNSDFMAAQGRALAHRILTEAPPDVDARIDRLFMLTLARPPRAGERAAARRFLDGQSPAIKTRIERGESVARLESPPPGVDAVTSAAWADLCLAQLNLNEFVYVR